jgi:hypothetical protein
VANTINELNDYYNNAVLAWIFGLLFTGNEPFELPDQIYGFPPSGGGISDPIWFGGRGIVSRGFRGSSREGTMAHEINHNLDTGTSGTWGRHIPYGCGATGPDPSWPFSNDDIQEVGFDTRLPWVDGSGTRDTVIPSNFPDFMSYCQSDDLAGNPAGQLPTKWISTYRWQQMFTHFGTAAQSSLDVRASAIETVYYVTGQLNNDGTGSLSPILVQPGLPTENVAPGDYVIEIQNTAGTALSTLPFFASFTDLEGEAVDAVYFNFQLVEQADAAQIVLKHDGQVLDTIVASSNPPTVKVLSPNGGESWSGPQTIRWQASDPDGDPLQFNILYTPDDGTTWFPVAAGVQGNSYDLDTASLAAGNAARVRVIATDGLNTAEDDSDNTFVVESIPEVTIDSPSNLAHVESGQAFDFSGDATDQSLAGEAFVWSYGPTVFGTGRQVSAALPDGIHEITLSASGAGGQATDQITVLVGDLPTVYLPIVLRK